MLNLLFLLIIKTCEFCEAHPMIAAVFFTTLLVGLTVDHIFWFPKRVQKDNGMLQDYKDEQLAYCQKYKSEEGFEKMYLHLENELKTVKVDQSVDFDFYTARGKVFKLCNSFVEKFHKPTALEKVAGIFCNEDVFVAAARHVISKKIK